ncbi:hypothetical protein [Streptomyces hygroscopicus]|uniref:Uncharacterized protein n=1 Tax=Streptomyces demainii TaxID=588122 RepID=A0ABT9KPT1_9ACTN|nr:MULTISPECIES: hypothetical protein [Streptomyces]MDP9610420.1 hypothetical protein [Streptomyces demainii]
MRHRRRSTVTRTGSLALRVARMGVLLCVVPALLVLAVRLCFAGAFTP